MVFAVSSENAIPRRVEALLRPFKMRLRSKKNPRTGYRSLLPPYMRPWALWAYLSMIWAGGPKSSRADCADVDRLAGCAL